MYVYLRYLIQSSVAVNVQEWQLC